MVVGVLIVVGAVAFVLLDDMFFGIQKWILKRQVRQLKIARRRS